MYLSSLTCILFSADMDLKRHNSGSLTGDAPQAKWAKNSSEWEDSPSQFEEELLMLNEADLDIDDLEAEASQDVIPVGAYAKFGIFIIYISPVYFSNKIRLAHYFFCILFMSVQPLSPTGDLFSTNFNPRWRRPPAPALNPSTDTLVFQQIDLDYYSGK